MEGALKKLSDGSSNDVLTNWRWPTSCWLEEPR